MPDPDNDTRISATIIQLQREMIERLYKGDVNFEGSKRLIERHQAIATRLDDQYLLMRLQEASAILHAWFGYFDESFAAFEAAINTCKALNDNRLPYLISNLGETYRIAGEYGKAVEVLEEAVKLADTLQDHRAQTQVATNLGLSLLPLNEFQRAGEQFEKVINMTANETWNFITQLVEVRRGLAEVHLEQGNHEAAWRYAADAMYLAKGRKNGFLMMEVYITMGHIAERYPDAPGTANHYYQEARELLKAQNKGVPIARLILQEALYQYFHDNLEDARRLAKEAHQMFLELKVDGDARLAHYLVTMDVDT